MKAAGSERIYREKASGGRWDRPELHRLLDQLREDDVPVVWKLDRQFACGRPVVLWLAAPLVPARRAMRADPGTALKYEG